MEQKRTSLFENGLIWFGAAVSIAEILTGTYFAPLGFAEGLTAILLGHGIGCVLLFFAGLIGARTRKSAMETVTMSFGQKGSLLFSFLNLLQLIGWTGIMIYDGAIAANGIWSVGKWIWCLVIGALITLWVLIGVKNLGKVNTAAMAALFCMTVALSFGVFGRESQLVSIPETMTFGAAVELSAAMPLSWLPLISDYTRDAKRPVGATAVSAVVYGIVSCWMYLIGMSAASFTGESDIASILLKTGLGAVGLGVVVLSTVTTTFMDAYSSGVTVESIFPKVNGKWIAVGAAVVGTAAAVFFPLDNITDFLYLIGSVFTPMIAVQIADHFFLRADHSDKRFAFVNLAVWLVGFILYRLLMRVDTPVGSSLPDMFITMAIAVIAGKLVKKCQKDA